MAYFARMMRAEDASVVTEIDREAFATQWPPPNYKRELQNNVAHYIVACEEGKNVTPVAAEVTAKPGLVARIRRFFRPDNASRQDSPPSTTEYVIGFVGIWVIADEAHITSIATRERYRGRGIGELLLIAIVYLAARIKTRTITLEVRVSNSIAQNLYTKYGFTRVGIRRGYYTDNREDAILMSTPDISSVDYQQQFQKLKQSCLQKLGDASLQVLSYTANSKDGKRVEM